MQLINIKTGFVLVEFKNDKSLFRDPFLEKDMKKNGILIPPFLREEFGGKKVVYLGEEGFQKAFKEIYYPFSLKAEIYRWKVIE